MKGTLRVLAVFSAVACFVGCIGTHSREEESKSVTNLQTLIEQWHAADGGAVFEVEDRLFASLLTDPNGFYRSLANDSTGFSRFVVTLQAGVFTEYGDRSIRDLESKRRESLKVLSDAVVEAQYVEMNKVIIDALARIKPTKVD